jgi:oxalate decarboxylase/phosphoglucose isomerase-like protein (cupin superfamily)
VGAGGHRPRAAHRKEDGGREYAAHPGGVRELHWHKEAEWAYMIDGSARVTAVDQNELRG